MKGLNSNQLKCIAMITMTVDHVGLMLFPRLLILRIIGRLAFPIYAYMIAEGCIHTRSLPRYLLSLGSMGFVCQLVYFFAMGSLYQCIMVTFSLSVALYMALRWAAGKGFLGKLVAGAALLAALFLTEGLSYLLKGTDYAVDYGFIGVILPVALALCSNSRQRLWIAAILLGLKAALGMEIQWFSLLAIPVLALYNGSRGSRNLKWLFYGYYPVHLAVIQGLVLLGF